MEGDWKPGVARNYNNPSIEDLLDDKTRNKVASDLRKGLNSKELANKLKPSKPVATYKSQNYTGKATPKSLPSKDQDLVSSMASKLQKLEKTNEVQRKEIKDQTRVISNLRAEVATLKKVSNEDYFEEYKKLQDENTQLKQQVAEMEEFLSDYGLKWVGNEPQGQLDVESLMQNIPASDPMYRYNLPREIDVLVLERRIEELNILAERDASKMVSEGGIHRFKAPERITITFFKNGLVLEGFPFKPYSSNQAQSILSDILDGYFPYDLKRKFPNGVPLKLVDRTSEMFSAAKNVVNTQNEGSLGLLSKDQFLSQLPQNVIKGGNVIPVREEVGRAFREEKSGTIEVFTHVDEFLLKSKEPKDKITTLRIRTEDGKRNLIIKMWYGDKLQDLRTYIETNREKSGNYEIRSTFPAKVFEYKDNRTLEELEMTPNFALALRALD
mmetsp:Transcript_2322/g.3695  ORF Transcript_2322/g.3695 Transcript_2322/m.3695 type:complete len:441 (-) Transcript_2322:121-1443(-)